MNKDELKQTLKEQFEPIDSAVQKKLTYLQSDDVFTDYADEEYPQFQTEDNMSVEDAFATFTNARVTNTEENEPKALNDGRYRPIDSIKVEQPTQETIQNHKQNIAAKIAALRGISMPGDYLNNKW